MTELERLAVALVTGLDGTMGRTWAQKVQELRSQEWPEEVDPGRLADVLEMAIAQGLVTERA